MIPGSDLGAARALRGGSAAVVVARRGKNTSARSSSVRRRAIPDARSSWRVGKFPTNAGF
jgi:hypothetical protein